MHRSVTMLPVRIGSRSNLMRVGCLWDAPRRVAEVFGRVFVLTGIFIKGGY